MEPIEVTTPSENQIKADLGLNYDVLKGLYPDWSNDLHRRGNFIAKENLLKIAQHGIVRWYTKHETIGYPYHIDYRYHQRLNEMYTPGTDGVSPGTRFRDFRTMVKLSSYFHREDEFYSDPDLSRFRDMVSKSSDFLNFCAALNGKNFHQIKHSECRIYMEYLNKGLSHRLLNTRVRTKSCAEMASIILRDLSQNYLSNDFVSLEALVWRLIERSYMKDLCVIFHRWKIILEKKSAQVIGKPPAFEKEMYRVSGMLDKLQGVLLAFIRRIVSRVHLSVERNVPFELGFDPDDPEFDSHQDLITEIKNPDSSFHCIVADSGIGSARLPATV